MRSTTGQRRSFTESERNRFRNLLKLANESPYEGERDAALAAAERMATARGMSLHEAASVGAPPPPRREDLFARSEEHTSELQSLMRISYAVFCLKKKKTKRKQNTTNVEP